jgi:hypothetical protein
LLMPTEYSAAEYFALAIGHWLMRSLGRS